MPPRTTTGWWRSGAATPAVASFPSASSRCGTQSSRQRRYDATRQRGVTAVAFSEITAKLGLPSLHSGYWEPFFDACDETDTLVCMHIGSSSQMPATSTDAPTTVGATLSFGNAMSSLSDFLFSGVLVRHPKLRLAYSEGQIGWMPYILERADDVWLQHRAWGGVQDLVPEPPSTYFHRQVFGCFFRDRHGLESLHRIGVDNVTFETDYPHTDSTWPDSKKIFEEQVARASTTKLCGSSTATRSASCGSGSNNGSRRRHRRRQGSYQVLVRVGVRASSCSGRRTTQPIDRFLVRWTGWSPVTTRSALAGGADLGAFRTQVLLLTTIGRRSQGFAHHRAAVLSRR